MSTRATYMFKGNRDIKSTSFYIHWDGYPEGAAIYFYNMLTSDFRGNLATKFIKANDAAEITDGHDAHDDTDYCYDIYGDDADAIITAYKINRMLADDKITRTKVCCMSLREFVNTYGVKWNVRL